MFCQPVSTCLRVFCVLLAANTLALASDVSSVAPQSVAPGTPSRLTLTGKDLDASLKLVSSVPAAKLRILEVQPTRAVIEVTLPESTPPGPFGLWSASTTSVHNPLVLMCDTLPPLLDNGANHSPDTAQNMSVPVAVTGQGNGAHADYYRFRAAAGQRLAFEVHTQQIQSGMDPVVRLLDANGNVLQTADDDSVGPDCRFSHTFENAGEYLLHVHDSGFASNGGRYYLRVGDFPTNPTVHPLAARRGDQTTVQFASADGAPITPFEVRLPEDQNAPTQTVPAKLTSGTNAAWARVLVTELPTVVESDPQSENAAVLSLPVCVSGRLQQLGEIDKYKFELAKGQQLFVRSHTRSLGRPTLLAMRLVSDRNGKLLTETKVAESHEWNLSYTADSDRTVELHVKDLLKRGGPDFGYCLEITSRPGFEVTLKPDAKARQEYPLEPGHGAAAIDIQITRRGDERALHFSLDPPTSGLRIVNPVIRAGAKAGRLYLATNGDWTADQLHAVRLIASPAGDPNTQVLVDGRTALQARHPEILAPAAWVRGTLAVSGAAASTAPFVVAAPKPLRLPRPVLKHTAKLQVKRSDKNFKAPVTLLGYGLPAGWRVAIKANKDAYDTTWTRTAGADQLPEQLTLTAFTTHNSRGRLEPIGVPVEWFDPLRVRMEATQPIVAGGSANIRVHVVRDADDPQPIKLTLSLPEGVRGPATIDIPATSSTADFTIEVPTETAAEFTVAAQATSVFRGAEFTTEVTAATLAVLPAPRELQVFPPKISLTDAASEQQVVVCSIGSDGLARDWTRDATLSIDDNRIARLEGQIIRPLTDGVTTLRVRVGSAEHAVPVHVSGSEVRRRTEFESDVLVALSKQGCNSGACHGSPSGKGGFRLSLRAFDRKLDELTLIREDIGRRTNPLDPDESLLLLKPLMRVPHGGGQQLRTDDIAFKVLRDWIESGARKDPDGTARCTKLHVYPPGKRVLDVGTGGQQLAITAHFADGATRDVTRRVAWESSDTRVATVDEDGFVTPHAQGETVILVRYLEHIEAVPLLFIQPGPDFQWTAAPAQNFIDELVDAKLKRLQLLPSECCTDAEFIRRVSLDVLGILPTIAETRAFLDDNAPTKRTTLIDTLLEREEYARFQALKWGDLLKMTGKMVGDKGVYKYHRWVEEAFRTNMPYDEFARQLLTGSGSTLQNPPANFYRTATDMNESVETISQVFLGARLQCAKCHNHPFERWTQDNYYGLGAFFNRVQRRKTGRPGELFIYSADNGEVTQPRTGQTMQPWLPGAGTIEVPAEQDRREAFAAWLVSDTNPYFAKIEANRIWSSLFARGIVEPIDDFRESNPPSNRPLLDALAARFTESGYDRKQLIRTILNSRTYQASFRTNESNVGDNNYFSHQQPRMLTAEQLLDAINSTLELEDRFGNLPAGTRATQLVAPDLASVDFLRKFGQSERNTVCACERPDDSNLGMAIELFNGKTLQSKLTNPKNRFRSSIAADQTIEQVVRDMYLAAVCRPPSPTELNVALKHCESREDKAAAVADICWALFNTDEFLFQH